MGMSQAYGPADDAESRRTLDRALDVGITLLDTAQSYGRGHNERLLSDVLARRRDEIVLATKFGIVRREDGTVGLDARPDRIRDYCEASLQRLGIDAIDLYYLHRVDPDVPVEDSIGAMAELVAEGKVAHLGISEADAATIDRAAATHPIAALQTEWSLWWREIEDDVIPAARRNGLAIVPYSPLGRGFLSGQVHTDGLDAQDLRGSDPRMQGENLERNRAMVADLQSFADERGVSSAQLAIAWLLAQGEDVVPIPGTKRSRWVEANAAAADITLSPEDLARIGALVPRERWQGDRVSYAAHGTTRGR